MTIDEINITDYDEKLAKKLNCITNWGEDKPLGSIMGYGDICKHDNGYLCEHRLEYILKYVKNLK
jgi:hypothetical protein